MFRIGKPPYLECSSEGDKRFSAFYASPRSLYGQSIESAYQAMKILEDGRSGLTWKEAKGKPAVNIAECRAAYKEWWRQWVIEQNLLEVLFRASGLSDRFGFVGQTCQAQVLWEIRNEEWDKKLEKETPF